MKIAAFKVGAKIDIGVFTKDGDKIVPLSSLPLSQKYDSIASLIDAPKSDIKLLEDKAHQDEGFALSEDVHLLSPFPAPGHDILCVGVNYMAHREEAHKGINDLAKNPPKTVYFSKRATSTIGHGDTIDARFDLDEGLDYEVELAVIIGKGGKDISPENAQEHIFGYTIFNDLTARTMQNQHLQWFKGKSLDGLSAIGPWVVTAGDIAFPPELDIKCSVNGEVRQNSNTKLMIADIPTIISQLSAGMTLMPGDIIATGTPSGVAIGFTPPKFLKSGDVVKCEIEGIGVLENRVK